MQWVTLENRCRDTDENNRGDVRYLQYRGIGLLTIALSISMSDTEFVRRKTYLLESRERYRTASATCTPVALPKSIRRVSKGQESRYCEAREP